MTLLHSVTDAVQTDGCYGGCRYLVDMVGVSGSALQEHGGDPDVDEGTMGSE